MSRRVIQPARRLEGQLRVPGDKSITHRALMVAAVGEGTAAIDGPCRGADIEATIGVLEALGAVISYSHSQVEADIGSSAPSQFQILVEGSGWAGLRKPGQALQCGNSGTTARAGLGILAGRPFEAQLDGDESLRGRPMLRVVEPLRSMGATIDGAAGGDRLPLVVRGGPLKGLELRLEVASAQVKTALILAGLQADGETAISEPHQSRDHTERMLAFLGARVRKDGNRVVVESTNLQVDTSLRIPGDLSSAAFLLVAAAIRPGSKVRIRDVGLNPTRTGILDALSRFGAEVRISDVREVCGEPWGTVTVKAGERKGISIASGDVPRTIDELPLVAVLGAVAEGKTVIEGAAELRVKESDRVAAILEGLTTMGAQIEALPDGFVVHGPSRLIGSHVDAHRDHRVAMALAIAALAAEGETVIEGWESVAVSYPEFDRDLDALKVVR